MLRLSRSLPPTSWAQGRCFKEVQCLAEATCTQGGGSPTRRRLGRALSSRSRSFCSSPCRPTCRSCRRSRPSSRSRRPSSRSRCPSSRSLRRRILRHSWIPPSCCRSRSRRSRSSSPSFPCCCSSHSRTNRSCRSRRSRTCRSPSTSTCPIRMWTCLCLLMSRPCPSPYPCSYPSTRTNPCPCPYPCPCPSARTTPCLCPYPCLYPCPSLPCPCSFPCPSLPCPCPCHVPCRGRDPCPPAPGRNP
mmetsp:Transcript_114053/g.309906  ORF Transcript_114053/g.309906 Transcript_114053/m.309906 type:complete len:245 (-) Transcript_114053:521-1255(-)